MKRVEDSDDRSAGIACKSNTGASNDAAGEKELPSSSSIPDRITHREKTWSAVVSMTVDSRWRNCSFSQSVRATTDDRGSINLIDVDQRRSRSISVPVNAWIEWEKATIETSTIDVVCRFDSTQSSKWLDEDECDDRQHRKKTFESIRNWWRSWDNWVELYRAARRCSRTRRESHVPRDDQKAGRRFQWESKASLARMSSALLLCHRKNADAPSAVTLLRRGKPQTRAFPIGHLDFFLRSPSSKTTRLVRWCRTPSLIRRDRWRMTVCLWSWTHCFVFDDDFNSPEQSTEDLLYLTRIATFILFLLSVVVFVMDLLSMGVEQRHFQLCEQERDRRNTLWCFIRPKLASWTKFLCVTAVGVRLSVILDELWRCSSAALERVQTKYGKIRLLIWTTSMLCMFFSSLDKQCVRTSLYEFTSRPSKGQEYHTLCWTIWTSIVLSEAVLYFIFVIIKTNRPSHLS